jgi:hypothetical protein
MTRLLHALLASTLLGCAGPAPAPTAPPSQGGAASAATEITGRLSRKGPAETSYWAVTDATGTVWEIVEPSADLDARLRTLQNGQVTLRVEPRGKLLLQQVKVLEIVRPAPSH